MNDTTSPAPEGLDEFLGQDATATTSSPHPVEGELPDYAHIPTAPEQDPTAGLSDKGIPEGLNEFLGPELKEAKFGTPAQQGLTALEGAGEAATFGLSTGLERAAGIPAENIQARREVNPGLHTLGEVGSLGAQMLTGVGEAQLLAKAGKGAAEILGLGAKGASALAKIGASGIDQAAQMALLQGGDEVSKFLSNDPHQSAQTALSSVGISALLGGGTGAALGALSPLWEATVGNKASQFVEDFKSRINDHLTNPEPSEAVTKELGEYYNKVKDLSDETWGPKGLKAQEISKAVPEEITPKITEQVQNTFDNLNDLSQKMQDSALNDKGLYPKHLANKFNQEFTQFQDAVTQPGATPSDLFNAQQELKQTLQSWAKDYKRIPSTDPSHDFISAAKDAAYDLRTALEDPAVWGKAAERQQSINSAFSEYLPHLKDFEKKFTTEVGGERVINPGSVQTYMNQVGKASGDVRRTVLGNFLDKSKEFTNEISKTHVNLGMETPVIPSSLQAIGQTLQKPTLGGKVADIFIKDALAKVAGSSIGASIGGSLTGGIGAGVGAIVGDHVLSPFMSTILPALARKMAAGPASGSGLRAAVDFGLATMRGENLLGRGASSLFKAGAKVLPESYMPTEKQTSMLNKRLLTGQTSLSLLTDAGGKIGHYFPDHQQVLAQTAGNAVNYLNSLRPNSTKAAPLDGDLRPSPTQQSRYVNALKIAEAPAIVLHHIKEGTLTINHIQDLKAMYPAYYANMAQKVSSAMINAVNKGQEIPYKQRIALSMFLGQPVDSTLSPASIRAAQSASLPQSGPAQQGSPPVNKVKHSTAPLSKLSSQYQTPGQAAESRRAVRD